MARAADAFFGFPDAGARGRRGHRDEREDDDRVPAVFDPRGGGPAAGTARDDRDRGSAGERREVARTTPEAIDLQRTFREMLDAGDRSCALEASSHGSELKRLVGVRFAALVFTNLSPGPPRLPRDARGVLRREAAAVRRAGRGRQPPSGGGQRRRPVGRAAGGGAAWARWAARDVLGARRGGSRARGARADAWGSRFSVGGIALETRAARPLQRRERARGGCCGPAARGRGRRVVRGVGHVAGVPGRFEAVDEGQPFAVLVDYAHTPDALANVLAEARGSGCGAARSASSAAAATATGPSVRSWAAWRPARRRRDRHVGQSAQRGSGRDHRRDPRRARTGARRSSRTARRRSRRRSSWPRRATSSSSPARATSRARSSPTGRSRSTTGRWRARRCGDSERRRRAVTAREIGTDLAQTRAQILGTVEGGWRVVLPSQGGARARVPRDIAEQTGMIPLALDEIAALAPGELAGPMAPPKRRG